ncbi:uncharacterized protein LOC143248624 [Tachypleus tridentatus]|uniref:uncharacterized protein LOC143248624 n=1 Tax=Tachypleus tridentatus TaxID=6853 RepID=UPI003FCEF3E9
MEKQPLNVVSDSKEESNNQVITTINKLSEQLNGHSNILELGELDNSYQKSFNDSLESPLINSSEPLEHDSLENKSNNVAKQDKKQLEQNPKYSSLPSDSSVDISQSAETPGEITDFTGVNILEKTVHVSVAADKVLDISHSNEPHLETSDLHECNLLLETSNIQDYSNPVTYESKLCLETSNIQDSSNPVTYEPKPCLETSNTQEFSSSVVCEVKSCSETSNIQDTSNLVTYEPKPCLETLNTQEFSSSVVCEVKSCSETSNIQDTSNLVTYEPKPCLETSNTQEFSSSVVCEVKSCSETSNIQDTSNLVTYEPKPCLETSNTEDSSDILAVYDSPSESASEAVEHLETSNSQELLVTEVLPSSKVSNPISIQKLQSAVEPQCSLFSESEPPYKIPSHSTLIQGIVDDNQEGESKATDLDNIENKHELLSSSETTAPSNTQYEGSLDKLKESVDLSKIGETGDHNSVTKTVVLHLHETEPSILANIAEDKEIQASTVNSLVASKTMELENINKAVMEESILDIEIQSQIEREKAFLKDHNQAENLRPLENKKEISKPFVIVETYSDRPSSAQRSLSPQDQTAEKSPSNVNTESKIAMEIRELKEREDELRKMRKHLDLFSNKDQETWSAKNNHTGKNTAFSTVDSTTNSNAKELPFGGYSHSNKNSPVPSLSLRRKEEIRVRPLIDTELEDEKPVFQLLKESPVEREVRLTKEREDAWRKQRGTQRPSAEVKTNDRFQTPKTQSSRDYIRPNTLHLSNGRQGTQKALATTRIQQEIEEQTQRELALREAGQIQTISQERTDAKVSRVGESIQTGKFTKECFNATKKLENSVIKSPSPTIQIFEKPPAPNSKVNEARVNGLPEAPSPSSSSSSSSSTLSVGRKYISHNTVGRSISMQKFIASKGKEIRSITSPVLKSPLPVGRANGHQVLDKRGSSVKPPAVQRKSISSTETKIQEELKEMKSREEELR